MRYEGRMAGKRVILGIGSGRCGTLSLANLLDRQPGCHVTHERRPLLHWDATDRAEIVRHRISRLCRHTAETVGDVSSAYLPYLEETFRQLPDVRVVCMKRPCEEVAQSFGNWLDRVHVVPTDHWSQQPADGWYHDPVWSVMFPKYAVSCREEGIRQYWNDYYEQVDSLLHRFPDNIRVFQSTDLNDESARRELLSFTGVPLSQQVVDASIHVNRAEDQKPRNGRGRLDASAPERCVILVPHGGEIFPRCEESLQVLEQRGYTVRRVKGYSQIDVARNEIAAGAMRDGFEEMLWIDSDVGFDPASVEKLRAHQLPIVCGIYPKKAKRALSCSVLPGTKVLKFGDAGGLAEIQYAATGFLLVRRQVYIDIQEKLKLPLCNELFGQTVIPYFQPMALQDGEANWYLGEDFAFCERARQAGHRIMADTSIRLWHIGNYAYGWEDAGRDVERFSSYEYRFPD